MGVNVAESEALATLERFINAIGTSEPACMRKLRSTIMVVHVG